MEKRLAFAISLYNLEKLFGFTFMSKGPSAFLIKESKTRQLSYLLLHGFWSEDHAELDFVEEQGKYYAVGYRTYCRNSLHRSVILDEKMDITVLVLMKINPFFYEDVTLPEANFSHYDEFSFVVEKDIREDSVGYCLEKQNNSELRELVVVYTISRNDNPKWYDEASADDLVELCPVGYLYSAEFETSDNKYYVFFNDRYYQRGGV